MEASRKAFRTSELVIDSSTIKTGGQYNTYAWEHLSKSGKPIKRIGKHIPGADIYGSKAFLHNQDFWEINSTTPSGLWSEKFELNIFKNNKPQKSYPRNNLNPLSIAYDRINSDLYIAGWTGFEQHKVEIYRINLKDPRLTLVRLPKAVIRHHRLVRGDQLVINEMKWDHNTNKLVFVGDAHSYNSKSKKDYGIIGSYDPKKPRKKPKIKYHTLNGFIGDGSLETFQSIDNLTSDYYLIGGNDSTSPNTTTGEIMLVRKADLSIRETVLVDIKNNPYDHIKDILVDDNSDIFIGGSGGVHKVGRSTQVFESLPECFIVSKPRQFKKKFVAKIDGFDAKTDTLNINIQGSGGNDLAKFSLAKNWKAVKRLINNKIDFIYNQQNGSLYFNENKEEKGFGDGGIVAMLEGSPRLTKRNLKFAVKTIYNQKLFKKNSADKITNFNPSRHALIIDCPSFGIDNSATVTFAKDGLSFRQSIQKDNQFVYYKKNGGLYFNENKSLNGFGDGGIIAILKGAPDLTSENIGFL